MGHLGPQNGGTESTESRLPLLGACLLDFYSKLHPVGAFILKASTKSMSLLLRSGYISIAFCEPDVSKYFDHCRWSVPRC
jgi:hypothetical protein